MTATSRVFELRTYHAAPGKMDALQARFRDHTMALFARHGMDVVGFWVPVDAEGNRSETLVYLLAFADRATADKLWGAFREDPDWIKARADSEVDGRLTASVESVFMTATDYSPLR